jgi:hypothetical protein
MESFSWSAEGLTVDCKGAMYQLDNYQAKPEYPSRPIPYEFAIARQWEHRPDLRLRRPRIEWPTWWPTKYAPIAKAPLYTIPVGVHAGDNWSGLVTRSTGKWEPVLTSYITTLLASWYTDRGRMTMDLLPGRQPIIRHRDFKYTTGPGVLVIDAVTPGVELALNQDFSQSINAVFGQGKALTGEGYSGQVVTNDGLQTDYLPLASLRQVHPPTNTNGWLDPSLMRREILLEIQQGLEEKHAQAVANNHLNRFADPGVNGTITLKSDPYFTLASGVLVYMPRFLIKPGMSIQIPGLFGRADGQLFHISEVVTDTENQSTTLVIDTKYRDALTTAEVMLRGRDSLSITRSLIGGQYQPPVSDQLLPWNYAEGSGFIPSGGGLNSVPLFRDQPSSIRFPWTEITRARPPGNKAWRNCYVRIGPKSSVADNNWAYTVTRNADPQGAGHKRGIPIKMSQAGSIRLLQIAAYDAGGNVMKIPFHVSLYYNNGVSPDAMPQIRAVDTGKDGYAAGQHYPFFDSAWENYNLNGTKILTEQTLAKSSVRLIRAYGTRLVPGGYWPGDKPQGDAPTGALVDEDGLDYDCTSVDGAINLQIFNHNAPFAGFLYAMIYADAQAGNEVFFMGRCYRTEPGTSG